MSSAPVTLSSLISQNNHFSKVVGGTEVDPNRYPYHASLFDIQGFFFCGGSLIAPNVVLTASHCLDAATPFIVALNCPDLEQVNTCVFEGKVFNVVAAIQHPFYNSFTEENDVAVVVLNQDVINIEPLFVATPDFELFEGQDVTTIGHGATVFTGDISTFLLEAEMEVTDPVHCNNQYRTIASIISNVDFVSVPDQINSDVMFCTIADGRDACQGDSGGAIISRCEETQEDLVVGVVSFGVGCAYDGIPGVLAKTFTQSAFDFINGVVTGEGHTLKAVSDFSNFCVFGGTQPADRVDEFPTTFPTFDPNSNQLWTCSGDFFASGDGCDCGCGLPDPDCEFDDEVFGCTFGGCNAEGECELGALTAVVGVLGTCCVCGIIAAVVGVIYYNQSRNNRMARNAFERQTKQTTKIQQAPVQVQGYQSTNQNVPLVSAVPTPVPEATIVQM